METDYLIIGQGISGTLLSRALLREGKKVIVIDDGDLSAASRVASGVINPVTGMRLVRTWMGDTLLPFAQKTYTELGDELGVTLVKPTSILGFHRTRDDAALFIEKMEQEQQYLHIADDQKWQDLFRFNYGIGEIAPCLLVDMHMLLTAWRGKLQDSGNLITERFNWNECEVTPDKIVYKDTTAEKLILCDGVSSTESSYFGRLPWSKDKGEALIAAIPGLPAGHIYKQGMHIVPWHDRLFWIGATHDWKFSDMQPTAAFRKQVEEQLNYWLKLPYEIKDHIVAQRPTNLDRKPFVGFHPMHPSVGIFNGMGTKGCSVAPYFANQFARHIVYDEPLLPEVDVRRFTKVLSR